MANNYPNGWKDGYSSADHATESYSPYAWKRAQRNAAFENSYEENRAQKHHEDFYDKRATEVAKEEHRMKRIEQEAIEDYEQRKIAINYIVQQKRNEYNKKSWFGKVIAKIKGKDFDKQKSQIVAQAEKRVNSMDEYQLESFIERNIESGGRSR